LFDFFNSYPKVRILVNISQWPKTDMRWYLGVRCRKCQKPILFALDRTEGTGEGETVSAGKLVLTCTLDKCKHQADYSGAAVSRFQKKGSPTETRRNDESGKGRKHKR
jgi:hypothetical protein